MPRGLTRNSATIRFALVTLLSVGVLIAVGEASDSCASKAKCHECIRTRGCSWCTDEHLPAHEPHCNTVERQTKHCNQSYYGPEPTQTISPPTLADSTATQTARISPERIDLFQLRVNEPFRVQLTYTQPKNYPVDFYLLMDMSLSMEDDRKTLSQYGQRLFEIIGSQTNDYQLGLGSFIEKPVLPFSYKDGINQPKDCQNCKAYAYVNSQKLTKNPKDFISAINDAEVAGNLDGPEAGLDALVQAIVCGDHIGWRKNAQRMILYVSDNGFHYAGDGRLAGIIKRNDGECHLENGVYAEAETMDYPSVSQVNQLAVKHSVSIIFAVTDDQRPLYEMLSREIQGSTFAVLNKDSSNIHTIIDDKYKKIRNKIVLKDDANPDHIRVAYYSRCNGAAEMETNICQHIKNGEAIEFGVEFTVLECPKDEADWQQTVEIYSVGAKAKVLVNIALLCKCDCERVAANKSSSCSDHGKVVCGICDCDDGYFGANCMCKGNENDLEPMLQQCRQDNVTCSDRGTCECGKCKCASEDVSGTFCELDNVSCESPDGKLCSDNGRCVANQCVCNRNFTGPACECSSSTDNCGPITEDGHLCSGHGVCECNDCVCRKEGKWQYSGVHCQDCWNCKCDQLKRCVWCLAFDGPDTCGVNCSHIGYERVVDRTHFPDESFCVFDEDDCRLSFVVSDGRPPKSQVQVIIHSQCQPPTNTAAIICGVVGAIVIVGIGTMVLWKVLTTMHDRREYARFEKEHSTSHWETWNNPLFKDPTSTFKNPLFTGSD